MESNVNIVLVLKTGGDYHFSDVVTIVRHLGVPNIYCIYDAVEIPYKLINHTLLPMPYKYKGWWSKMNLFSPELAYLRPFLYLDLDTVVFGDVSGVFPNGSNEGGLIMLRDFYQTSKAASGVMWIPKDNPKVDAIWNAWIKNPVFNMKRFRGDQEFIRSVVTPDYYWQDIVDGIVSFKPKNVRDRRKVLTGDEKLVCFHGKPRIREAAQSVKWVQKYLEEVE